MKVLNAIATDAGKQKFSAVASFFYAMDIFKTPLRLIFNKRQFISTKIGQLLSLVVIILELIVFLKSDFLNHQSPSTFTSNLKTNNRLPLNLFQKIAAVGIGEDMPMGRMIDSSVY